MSGVACTAMQMGSFRGMLRSTAEGVKQMGGKARRECRELETEGGRWGEAVLS